MNTSNEQPNVMGSETPQSPTSPPPAPPPGWAPSWGAAPAPAAPPATGGWTANRKSPFLAGLLSGIFPGVGQVYLGYYQRGFVHAIVFAGLISVIASGSARGFEPLFGMGIAFWYLYNLVDAVRRASLYNQALAGMRPAPLPEDFKMPSGRPSLFWGAAITVLGFIFLAHTRFDFDLDWLLDWWPAVFVAIGLHMVYRAMRERSSGSPGR